MKFIASISLIAVFIFGIIKMREASSEIKSIWFRELSNSNKLKVTSKVKENWKKTIILAITIAAMLIIISLFIGKTHNNDNLVSIVMLIVSIIVLFFIIYYNKKFKKELNNFKNQI